MNSQPTSENPSEFLRAHTTRTGQSIETGPASRRMWKLSPSLYSRRVLNETPPSEMLVIHTLWAKSGLTSVYNVAAAKNCVRSDDRFSTATLLPAFLAAR